MKILIMILNLPGISICSSPNTCLLSLYHVISGVGSPVTLHKMERSLPTLYVLPFGMTMLTETGTIHKKKYFNYKFQKLHSICYGTFIKFTNSKCMHDSLCI